MTGTRVLSALALLLAVVALGTVAGGLTDGGGASEQSDGVGIGSGEGSGIGESDGFGLGGGDVDRPDFPTWLGIGPFLLVLWITTGAGLLMALVFLWQASLGEILRTFGRSVGYVVGIGVAIVFFYLFLLLLSGLFGSGGGGFMGGAETVSEGLVGEASSTESTSLLPDIVLLAGAAAMTVLLVVILRDDEGGKDEGGGTVVTEEESQVPTSSPATPIPAVEDPDASNEVYRAWASLRERVGRPERSESPAELRRRALDAGLDESAVSELTALFNETRYGDRPVTDAEARRARDALDALDGNGGHS